MKRRDFLKFATAAVGAAALPRWAAAATRNDDGPRPNFLWISAEDISADVRCYGDDYAVTPNLDAFAAQGVRYDACFAHMGVCAPARSGIITGMYPTSIGTNPMRCQGVPPPEVKCFTEYLRAKGYYCTNRSKTDYQFASPPTAWDVCGGSGHWRGRAQGQPFFAVVNIGTTHEGQVRSKKRRVQLDKALGPKEKHDPARAALPPYYPDTPLVRRDWAQYYDLITLMDREVARILKDLEGDGLAEDTIVWFWGDHGRGLPRGKRWIYDSGLRVPLIVRVPEKLRSLASPANADAIGPGSACLELVSFVDFAPTMLSLAGIAIPEHIQGQAFLGPQKAKPRRYVYAARDRVDEAHDIIRAVRDHRYKYIRNFMPHLPRSLDVAYMNSMTTMQEMRRLHREGKLTGPQLQYFEATKPIEELYDTVADPHEVRNLAGEPKHRVALERLREECCVWMLRVGDVGLIPEADFDEMKGPGGQYEVTAAPGVSPAAAGVELSCSTPGASIAYRVEGGKGRPPASGQFLWVRDAKMHGKGARRRAGKVSAWRDPKTWFSWQVDIATAGRIPVHAYQAFARRDGGQLYVVVVGDQKAEGVVQETGGWDKFQFVRVGEVQVPRPGRYTVAIKPARVDRPYSMDLRAIVLDGQHLDRYQAPGPWRVYSRPVALEPGQCLTAQACRLGFRNSEVVLYVHPGRGVAAQQTPAKPHWRRTVDESGVVDRLLAIKALDGEGEKASHTYVRALTGRTRDPAGPVRYWAVVGLHRGGYVFGAVRDYTRHVPLMRECLGDPSPAVRVAAAQALCDWGRSEEGLPVLLDALGHRTGAVRLYAATALNEIGDAAQSALDAVKAGLKDSNGYVRRMMQHTLRGLAQ